MAAPSSSAPKRLTPSRSSRKFTLQQANSALPLVQRIVSDIVKTHALAATRKDAVESAQGPRQTADAQRDFDAAVDRLDKLVEELTSVGVELKDYETGLIDFVGRHEGRDVYLCWKLGEEKITHFHELNAGFAGRKPVTLLRED